MIKIFSVILAYLIGGWCWADDYRMWTVTTGTNAALAVTNSANPFTGEIDEISVYTSVGVTGAVAIAAIDPYDSSAFVLATNAAVTVREIWRPRIEAPAVGGATSFVVTNTATADRFNAHGEIIRAIVSSASQTGQVFRIYLKIKN